MSINVIVCFLTSSDGCFSILNIYFTGRRRKTKAATRDAWRFPRGLSWWFPRRCGRIPWGLPWWCRRIPRGRWGIHWYWRSRRYLKTAVSQPLHVSKLYRRHKRSCTSTTGGKKWRTPMTKPYFLTFFLQGWYYCVTREIQICLRMWALGIHWPQKWKAIFHQRLWVSQLVSLAPRRKHS